MPCPISRYCYFYRALPKRREVICKKPNEYKYCIYYTICKDFKNIYECTKAIYLYERHYKDVWLL